MEFGLHLLATRKILRHSGLCSIELSTVVLEGTVAIIVSEAVAERCRFRAYFMSMTASTFLDSSTRVSLQSHDISHLSCAHRRLPLFFSLDLGHPRLPLWQGYELFRI